MIGVQTLVLQQTQQGIFQGLAVPVPPCAASVSVRAIMNSDDITSVGVVAGVSAIASDDFGATWREAGAVKLWYSGPQTSPNLPGQTSGIGAPGVIVPVWLGMTHYSGVLTLASVSNVGLSLTWHDAAGVML